EVSDKTKLTCSIGIANCRVTAKIASDFKKPAGCTVVDNQKEFLAPLAVKKIPGIGKKSISKYHKSGILTVGDLANADVFKLMDIGGKHAVEYQKIAKGEKQVELMKHEERKSVSLEHTFKSNQLNKYGLLEAIDIMCLKIHARIKNEQFKTISIKIKNSRFKAITRDYSLQSPTNSLKKLKEITHQLFNRAYEENTSIRLIGVKVTNFTRESAKQATLEEF
ncbi:MAG: hypothetical protein PF542_03375, partial [Nanoarchaeota archaeon]|nr:hypothetical protein [Nanoarchaeota archaeon]